MIEHVKDKVGRIRSEMHMCRYKKAVEQWQSLKMAFDALEESGIDLKNGSELKMNLKQELSLVQEILYIIEGDRKIGKSQTNVLNAKDMKNNCIQKMVKKSHDKSAGSERGSMEGAVNGNINKWGKKKQIKQIKSHSLVFCKWPKSEDKINEKNKIINVVNNVVQKQKQSDLQGMKLSEDEQQILQRDVILPMNLPQFFKKKEPHRLIICYFEKCNFLLKKLGRELSVRKQVTQLDSIDLWTQSGKNDIIQIYVSPFESSKKDMIIKILQANPKNIVVFYSGINKNIYAEKLGEVKKQKFQLTFQN